MAVAVALLHHMAHLAKVNKHKSNIYDDTL